MRYMSANQVENALLDLIDECLEECLPHIKYYVCYLTTNIMNIGNSVVINNTTVYSEALSKVLCDCDKAVIFSATIGLGIDRLIAKYSRLSPSKALCMQAIGTERIEELCNLFYSDIKKEFCNIKPRFSPGYGDLSLSLQKDITKMLDTSRNIGVMLNESLIMSPSKSVTAIIGIERKE